MICVMCDVEYCKWNDYGECDCDEIKISDSELRADGFYPRCKNYENNEEVEE